MSETKGTARRRARGAVTVAILAALTWAGPAGAAPPARRTAMALVPALVRPPSPPWLLGNTAAHPPRVTWRGPSLVLVDSPERLTGPLLRSARGGSADAHLLYADQGSRLSTATWVFAYVVNAMPSHSVQIRLSLAPVRSQAFAVTYARGAIAAVGAGGLAVGMSAAASLLRPGATAWGAAEVLRGGQTANVSWRLRPGQVLSLWWPVRVTTATGRPIPYRIQLWESPGAHPPVGGPLEPTSSSVVRTTLPHVHGSVSLVAPTRGAWVYDLDNDAPALGGGVGGTLCPAFVCQNGEVESVGGAAFNRSADPLPGEMQPGVDALDAPHAAPALAVRVHGAILRTGNYGDYGSLLTLHLQAPPGRLLHAAVVPGFNRASPWAGETIAAGRTRTWQLGVTAPPPGYAYEIVSGVATATIRTTMVAGAYAPWRLVLWSTPKG